MNSSRLVLGLSVGSSLEGIDAAAVRAGGLGLNLTPKLERHLRTPLPLGVLESVRNNHRNEALRGVADAAVQAVRSLAVQTGFAARDVFALGLLEPAHPAHELNGSELADRIADATGITVIHGFRGRDRAAGGSGHPITAASDFLLLRHDRESRLLVHLGASSSVLLIPAAARIGGLHGCEAGPGSHLLDGIVFHGTRGKERTDPGGKLAVQGRCLEPLLARWLDHPYFAKRPPKAIPADAFGRSFLQASFDAARDLGAALPDVLCTANHLIARAIGEAWRTHLPTAPALRVFVSGGGTRNGFLWQLLAQQFEGVPLARTDDAGVPATARKAAAAANLALLTTDGVSGNVAPLTGAAAGRILGQIIPGDSRNWARCSAWLAHQAGDLHLARAA
jgi:anhydro-N-acetylmuramic acid kinase